jgi:hypothetical protein
MPETRPAPTTLLNTSRLLIVLGFVMVLATFTLKSDESPEKSDWLVLTLGVGTPVAFALGHLLVCVGTRCKRMKAAALGGLLCSPGAALLVVSAAGWYGRSGPMKPEIEPVVCLAWVLFPALAILSVIVIIGAGRAFPACAPKAGVCEKCGYDSAGAADDRWLRIAAVLRAWFRTAAAALSTMLKLPTEKRSREKRLVSIAAVLFAWSWLVVGALLVFPEQAVYVLLSVPFALVVGNVLIWRTTRSPAVRRLAQLSIGLVTAVVLLAIAGQFAPPTHSPSLGWLAVISVPRRQVFFRLLLWPCESANSTGLTRSPVSARSAGTTSPACAIRVAPSAARRLIRASCSRPSPAEGQRFLHPGMLTSEQEQKAPALAVRRLRRLRRKEGTNSLAAR